MAAIEKINTNFTILRIKVTKNHVVPHFVMSLRQESVGEEYYFTMQGEGHAKKSFSR